MHTVPRVVRLVVALALLVSASGLAVASVRSVSAAAVLTIKPISHPSAHEAHEHVEPEVANPA